MPFATVQFERDVALRCWYIQLQVSNFCFPGTTSERQDKVLAFGEKLRAWAEEELKVHVEMITT